MLRWVPFISVLCFVVVHCAAHASVRIEAVVDDRVLTSLDIEARERANGFFHKTSYAEGNRDEVLQSLIDEVVLELEAKDLGIPVEQEEIDQEVSKLFSVLGVCSGQNLDSCAGANNLDRESLLSHVRSRIIWNKILSARVAPFLAITEDEVAHYVAETRSNGLETVLDLEQVFVPFRAGAVLDSVSSELHKGVDLNKIAERYREHGVYVDRTVGAAIGGFVADVKAGLLRAEVGSVVGPVRIERGFMLMKVLGKVRVRKGFVNSIASLKQLSVPLSEADSTVNFLKARGATCATFEEVVKNAGFQPAGLVVRVRDLSSRLQLMLESAKSDEILRSDNGESGKVDFIMLCGITDGGEPSMEDVAKIRHAAYTEKLVTASNRLIETMRKRHFIRKL
ncbi:SurA N-terminal domain-containing protein [Candidatus Anaplasma sp. TIGMIC]|uniref:SurA N-terminal domain-containing protein n=1 Tax=Candidatus Anaplasma sp. TIGMIC TaxID=3020713 RepID=UPI00232C5BA3|nr:SurA N-terminal domain-containing protein [Candidatus Anaplasma sp. TIGMIC]MDB1135584.1 SurA N-terminal domain-containing protein [Candidatus Anaplasma sp. TIGMIC]